MSQAGPASSLRPTSLKEGKQKGNKKFEQKQELDNKYKEDFETDSISAEAIIQQFPKLEITAFEKEEEVQNTDVVDDKKDEIINEILTQIVNESVSAMLAHEQVPTDSHSLPVPLPSEEKGVLIVDQESTSSKLI